MPHSGLERTNNRMWSSTNLSLLRALLDFDMEIDWERNPYLKLFQESISYVLERQADLFSPEDLTCCHHILHEISSLGKYLLSRILGREGRWHRLDKLMKCLPREIKNEQRDQESVTQILEEGLEELQKNDLMVRLNSQSSFHEVWIILSNCLTVDELKVLHERISKTKSKGYVMLFITVPSYGTRSLHSTFSPHTLHSTV